MGSDINPYAYVHGRPLMGVDPDGRFGFLIGALIGLAIGAVTNIAAQAATVGFQNINWGITGVLGAALSGAVGGGVSAAVGGAVTSGLLSSGMGQVGAQAVGGFAAGYAGAAASQVTSLALTGNSSGFAQGILIGGIGGLAGGAVGGAVGGSGLGNVGGNVVAGLAGAAGGYVASLAFGGELSLESLGLSLGSGLAGGLASSVGSSRAAGGSGSSGSNEPGFMVRDSQVPSVTRTPSSSGGMTSDELVRALYDLHEQRLAPTREAIAAGAEHLAKPENAGDYASASGGRWPEGVPKCNCLVADAVQEAGLGFNTTKPGRVGIPNALELATGDGLPKGFGLLPDGSTGMRGDLVAQGRGYADASGHAAVLTSSTNLIEANTTVGARHNTLSVAFPANHDLATTPVRFIRYKPNPWAPFVR